MDIHTSYIHDQISLKQICKSKIDLTFSFCGLFSQEKITKYFCHNIRNYISPYYLDESQKEDLFEAWSIWIEQCKESLLHQFGLWSFHAVILQNSSQFHSIAGAKLSNSTRRSVYSSQVAFLFALGFDLDNIVLFFSRFLTFSPCTGDFEFFKFFKTFLLFWDHQMSNKQIVKWHTLRAMFVLY